MERVYQEVAKKLNLPVEEVKNAYIKYWEYFRHHIEKLPLKGEILTEEEFKKYRVSFNVPSIGKWYCTYKQYLSLRKSYKLNKEKYENKKSKTIT